MEESLLGHLSLNCDTSYPECMFSLGALCQVLWGHTGTKPALVPTLIHLQPGEVSNYSVGSARGKPQDTMKFENEGGAT